MRVWVTGGAGFVGSHLCDRLLGEGHEVVALDSLTGGSLANLARARSSERFSFHHIDVARPDLARLALRLRPQAIMHCAGQVTRPGSMGAPWADTQANLGAVLGVLGAAETAGVGRVVGVVHATPDAAAAPHNVAEVNAWTVADHLRLANDHLSFDTVTAVVANGYGPRQVSDGSGPVVARMVHDALTAGQVVVEGDGTQRRDFIYVDDLVAALAECVNAPAGYVVPVGSGKATSIDELARLVARLVRRRVDLVHEPARVPDVDRPAWPEPAPGALGGWAPWTDLEDGLLDTIADARAALVAAGWQPDDTGPEEAADAGDPAGRSAEEVVGRVADDLLTH